MCRGVPRGRDAPAIRPPVHTVRRPVSSSGPAAPLRVLPSKAASSICIAMPQGVPKCWSISAELHTVQAFSSTTLMLCRVSDQILTEKDCRVAGTAGGAGTTTCQQYYAGDSATCAAVSSCRCETLWHEVHVMKQSIRSKLRNFAGDCSVI